MWKAKHLGGSAYIPNMSSVLAAVINHKPTRGKQNQSDGGEGHLNMPTVEETWQFTALVLQKDSQVPSKDAEDVSQEQK